MNRSRFLAVTFIKSMEKQLNVDTLLIRVQNSPAYDVCNKTVIYTLHDLNTLTTDQGTAEAVICISVGTMDYLKSNTDSLNLIQRVGLSPDLKIC